MVDFKAQPSAATEFQLALESLRTAGVREELNVREIPAPDGLAPHAVAFAADVKALSEHEKVDLGTGRLVLLWDKKPQEAWASRFRAIVYAKSPVETDVGEGEDEAGLTWAWLMSALEQTGSSHAGEAGTATLIRSTGYGSLQHHQHHMEVELRASWSPMDTNFGSHFQAWQNLICMMAGHPLHNSELGRLDSRA